MGLIKKILGGFLAFLGGIAKVFGLGQKGDFYMELDESGAPTPATSVAPNNAAPVAADNNSQKVKARGKASKAAAAAKLKEAAPSSSAPVTSTAPKAKTAVTAPKSEAVPAAPKLTNFATDYLVNPKLNRAPRRRPGPSVSPFKDMAKQLGRRSTSMG